MSLFFSAEEGGFEPPVQLPVRQFSKLLVSATHPPFRKLDWNTKFSKAGAKVLLFFDIRKFFDIFLQKKSRLPPGNQSFHLTLNLIPWKTRCKSTAFWPYDQIFCTKSVKNLKNVKFGWQKDSISHTTRTNLLSDWLTWPERVRVGSLCAPGDRR